MKSKNHFATATCLLCGMFCAPPLAAQGGQIIFEGAIVAPICVAGGESAAVADTASVSGHLFSCAANPRAANPKDVSTYELSLARLNPQSASGSPLLEYFVGYLADAHHDDAKMLTRTYE